MFNALKYIKSLEGVGFPREQAEAQVQLVMDCFQDNVATKSDLAELKADLIIKLGGLIVVSVTIATSILGFLIKT